MLCGCSESGLVSGTAVWRAALRGGTGGHAGVIDQRVIVYSHRVLAPKQLEEVVDLRSYVFLHCEWQEGDEWIGVWGIYCCAWSCMVGFIGRGTTQAVSC